MVGKFINGRYDLFSGRCIAGSFTANVVLRPKVLHARLLITLWFVLLIYLIKLLLVCFILRSALRSCLLVRRLRPLLHALWAREAITTTFLLSLVAVREHLRLFVVLRIVVSALLVLVLIYYLVSYRQSFVAHMVNRSGSRRLQSVQLLDVHSIFVCAEIALIKLKAVFILDCARMVMAGPKIARLSDLVYVLFVLIVSWDVILNYHLLLIILNDVTRSLDLLLQEVTHVHKCINLILNLLIALLILITRLIIIIWLLCIIVFMVLLILVLFLLICKVIIFRLNHVWIWFV